MKSWTGKSFFTNKTRKNSTLQNFPELFRIPFSFSPFSRPNPFLSLVLISANFYVSTPSDIFLPFSDSGAISRPFHDLAKIRKTPPRTLWWKFIKKSNYLFRNLEHSAESSSTFRWIAVNLVRILFELEIASAFSFDFFLLHVILSVQSNRPEKHIYIKEIKISLL